MPFVDEQPPEHHPAVRVIAMPADTHSLAYRRV